MWSSGLCCRNKVSKFYNNLLCNWRDRVCWSFKINVHSMMSSIVLSLQKLLQNFDYCDITFSVWCPHTIKKITICFVLCIWIYCLFFCFFFVQKSMHCHKTNIQCWSVSARPSMFEEFLKYYNIYAKDSPRKSNGGLSWLKAECVIWSRSAFVV